METCRLLTKDFGRNNILLNKLKLLRYSQTIVVAPSISYFEV